MSDRNSILRRIAEVEKQLAKLYLRRFDLKIKFDYLKPDQAWALFQLVLKTDADDLCELHRQALSRLSNLTPGDFAVVVRRNRLSATPMSPQSLLEGLTTEVRTKQSHSKAIEFTAKN